jgi:chromosome segregation ATPase
MVRLKQREAAMAGSMKAWQDAQAQAQKILGKDGKLPKARTDVAATMLAANKAIKEIEAAKKALETKIDAVENACAKVKTAATQYGSMISGSDFELDPKKPDQKKQIADVQKVIGEALDKIETVADSFTKVFADLEKALDSLDSKLDEVS